MTTKSAEQRWRETGLNPTQIDNRIVALRRRGYSYKQIAAHVGMSESGAARAYQRLKRQEP